MHREIEKCVCIKGETCGGACGGKDVAGVIKRGGTREQRGGGQQGQVSDQQVWGWEYSCFKRNPNSSHCQGKVEPSQIFQETYRGSRRVESVRYGTPTTERIRTDKGGQTKKPFQNIGKKRKWGRRGQRLLPGLQKTNTEWTLPRLKWPG